MSEIKHIKIAQMGKFFLYLPIYYAVANRFFGYLPADYEVEVWLPDQKKDRTDKGVLHCLMDTASEENAEIQYAVCDPAIILDWPLHKTPGPVLLAAMVTNAAFWAVDRGSKEVNVPADLAKFDTIIAYDEGSTSYGIARRAFRQAGREPSIECVEPPNELLRLGASKHGTIALSPNLLEIEDFLWKRGTEGFNIDLALGKTPEYNNVLVTALLGRSDFVLAKENETLNLAIIRGLQRAMFLVRFDNEDVVKFVHDRFGRKPFDRILRALQMARDSQVFPASVEVSEAHWTNAANAYYDSRGKAFDDGAKKHARHVFVALAAPHAHWSTRAVQLEVLDRFRPTMPQSEAQTLVRPTAILPAITMLVALGFLGGFAAHGSRAALASVIVALSLSAGIALPRLVHRDPKGAAGALYGLGWIIALILSVWWLYRFDKWDFATAIFGITAAYFGAAALLAFAPKIVATIRSKGE